MILSNLMSTSFLIVLLDTLLVAPHTSMWLNLVSFVSKPFLAKIEVAHPKYAYVVFYFECFTFENDCSRT
jgi:hypothetical protein